MAVRYHRHICVTAGLHQLYEPEHCTFRKTGEGGRHTQSSRFVAQTADHAILQRLTFSSGTGICMCAVADATVAARFQPYGRKTGAYPMEFLLVLGRDIRVLRDNGTDSWQLPRPLPLCLPPGKSIERYFQSRKNGSLTP